MMDRRIIYTVFGFEMLLNSEGSGGEKFRG